MIFASQHIPCILEFYAASEGAVSFTNCEGKVGALGRVFGFLSDRFSVAPIRVRAGMAR
jgi:fatty-acyl-CoA synthase